jgi:hypothetical protein
MKWHVFVHVNMKPNISKTKNILKSDVKNYMFPMYTLHKVYPHQVCKLVTNTLSQAINCQMGEA